MPSMLLRGSCVVQPGQPAHGGAMMQQQLRSPFIRGKWASAARRYRLRPSTNIRAMLSGRDGGLGDDFGCDEAASSSHGVSPASLPLTQQCLAQAFAILDQDHDGLISRADAHRLVAYYLALQNHRPAPSAGGALTWDQHLLASMATAGKLSSGGLGATWQALGAFVASKLSGGLQKSPPRCSDLVYASLGMAAAMAALGLLAGCARTLPLVGPLHQAGLPLLLGSFGTFAILLFGRPDAEAVRLWPLLAGQLGATAIAVAAVQAAGASVMSRAAAMAATVAWMMWADCIHPPGGALVLMAMDSKAIQSINLLYLIWPSLALCLGVLLPISAATNFLRRNHQFDWPGSGSSPPASLHQKRAQWAQEQQMRRAVRELETLERGSSSSSSSSAGVPTQQLASMLAALVAGISGLWRAVAWQLQGDSQPRLEQAQQARVRVKKHRSLPGQQRRHLVTDAYDSSLDGGDDGSTSWSSTIDGTASSIDAVGQGPAAAAESLGAAVRQRLMREIERKLEDADHRAAIWGGHEQLPGLSRYEQKLERLQQERLGRQEEAGGGSGRQAARGINRAAPRGAGSRRWMYRWMDAAPVTDEEFAPEDPQQ